MAPPNAPRRHSCAPALLLALAAALLAAPIDAAIAAPQAGDACGPNNNGRWISATALAASGGAAVDGSGCIASDSGAGAFVRADLLESHTVYSAYFTGSGSGRAALRVGHVDLAEWIAAVRAGEHKLEAVLENQAQCARLALGAAPAAVVTECTAPRGGKNVGSFVTILAPSARVCGLMVCAKKLMFAADGTPLTREAAAMRSAHLQSTNPLAVSSAPGRKLAALSPKTCAGYESQAWGSCPDGLQCTSTYRAGGDVCGCGDCSAFTARRSCAQGDVQIGLTSCCFTCTYQPTCAVCSPPCVDVPTAIEVIPGTLPSTPDSYTAEAGSLSAMTVASNYGANPQQVSVSFAFTQSLMSSLSFTSRFTWQEKASLKIGIPAIKADGTLEFTTTQEQTTQTTTMATQTTSITYQLAQQVPPYTAQSVNATAKIGLLQVSVPVTIRTTYSCSGTQETNNTAVITVQGVMDTASSNLAVTYGTQYPLDPPIVYNQATAACSSHPLCRALGLIYGDCCPNAGGAYNLCCSFCVAKPACAGYASDNSTMCCPSRSNQMNPCCGK